MTELAMTMEQLTTAVQNLTEKFDNLKDNKIAEMSEKQAVMAGDLSRLQKVVYGSLAVVGVQTVGTVLGLFVWLIKR